MGKYLLIIDGSSLLSTQYYGTMEEILLEKIFVKITKELEKKHQPH